MKYYIMVINHAMQIGITDERSLTELNNCFNKRLIGGNKLIELNCTSYKNNEFKSYPISFNIDKLVGLFEVTKEQFIDYFSTTIFDTDLYNKFMEEGAMCEPTI